MPPAFSRAEGADGSFRRKYPDASPEKCARELVRTLKHELTHHIESLAMDRSLEKWDEQHVAELLAGLDDELIAECPEEEAERVKTLLEEEMSGAVSLSVPLTANAKTGRSWAEAH